MSSVCFLTKEIISAAGNLPHEDFPVSTQRVVVKAFQAAWSELRDRAGEELATSEEDRITADLEYCLNRIREDRGHPSGFRATLFQSVVRGPEVMSYDGLQVKKKPDLVVRLCSRRTTSIPLPAYRALFVECKIVDGSHPISDYGKKGLARFVDGRYAWSMPSAMMIAYTRGDYSVAGSLSGFLEKHRGKADPYRTRSLPAEVKALGGAVFVSKHGRAWTFPKTNRSPGPIVVLHLWLSTDSS
jgi:hypothetical protein